MMDSEQEQQRTAKIIVYIIIPLLVVILLLSLLTPASAQQIEISREGCEIREFREKAYLPFRVHMQHDPALKQRITDTHNDPASRWSEDIIERAEDEAPTNLSFFTESTDDWVWQIELEYLRESSEPREIIIVYEAEGIKFMTERLFHDAGKYFCLIIDANLRPAPQTPTAQEALEIADKVARERIKTITDSNVNLANQVERAVDTNAVLSLAVVVIFGILGCCTHI